MRQPPGFADPSKPDHYCLLGRGMLASFLFLALWVLHHLLLIHHYSYITTHTSLFILQRSTVTIFLLVYVYDIIVLSSLPPLFRG
jgi:hypothetical protein